MSQEIVTVLSKILFTSDSGDFLVAEFIDTQSAKRFRASGRISLSAKADAKQRYRLIGQWENNPKYGPTFVVVYSEAERPTAFGGIAPYLANNVKGIGEATAKKLVETLNVKNIDELITLCRNDKEKLFSFFGEKKRKIAENVISAIVADEVFRNIMIFLHEHNIPPRFAKRIYEKYGSQAMTILTENPYRLISDFRRVGFLRADSIAQKIGISPTSPFRCEAACIYALELAQEMGHCCLPRDVLVEKTRNLLAAKNETLFSKESVLEQIRQLYKRNKENRTETFVVRDLSVFEEKNRLTHPSETLFYLPETLRMEDEVAGFVRQLFTTPLALEYQEKKILEAQETDHFNELFPDVMWEVLSKEQKEAVKMSLSARLMILTGGPGCGKTFVLKAIYEIQTRLKRKVALCAPTGLAAKRMSASIGKQASTLHKMLGLGRKYQKNNKMSYEIEDLESAEGSLDQVDMVIVDESSMLSLELFHTLLAALGIHRRLILVGDVDQLPSVGAGNCLRDLIVSGAVPVIRLQRIFRQSSESPIPLAARSIIQGQKPEYHLVSHTPYFTSPSSFAFLPCSQDTFLENLLAFLSVTVVSLYGLDPIRDCQVLVPMRRSDVGQENINRFLQSHLNPSAAEKQECLLPTAGFLLREGDKVMQTRNNYELEVFNGDLGYCRRIVKSKEKLEVIIEFADREVSYEDEEVDDLQLCYAMTVHKSQGSEFSLCIIPMFGVYFTMLDRNLLYTAVTRASQNVILMGEDWAIKKAIGSQNAIKRHTFLEGLLRKKVCNPTP